MNHLDLDGRVECLRCGHESDFETGQWLDAVEHAQARAKSRDETPASHGSDALVEHRIHQKTLVTVAAAGAPTCSTCQAPLEVEKRPDQVPPPTRNQNGHAQLGGVIATAHARGAAEATIDGAFAARCPGCGAAVDHPTGSIVTRRESCKISLRIPTVARPSFGAQRWARRVRVRLLTTAK